MLARSDNASISANADTAGNGSNTANTAGCGSDWFVNAAKVLLGKDAGLHLHYITGYPERSCYYYASGERAPPAHFLRVLFHSPQGEPFFLAFMEGCRAEWWSDHKRARRITQAIDCAE